MGGRWRHFVAEAGRFLAVGGLATVVAVSLFNVLVHGFLTGTPVLEDHPLIGYAVANVAGMLVSYHGSRHWVFKHRTPVHADGGRTLFFTINTVTMVLPIACLAFSRHVLGLSDPLSDNVAANVVGLGLATASRFLLARWLVFQHPDQIERRRARAWAD